MRPTELNFDTATIEISKGMSIADSPLTCSEDLKSRSCYLFISPARHKVAGGQWLAARAIRNCFRPSAMEISGQ